VTRPEPPTQTVTTTARQDRTTTTSAAAAPTTSAAAPAADTNTTPWLWWLLGALAVAIAVLIPLLLRARRRGAWRADLEAAEGEVGWLARVLLPELRQASSLDQVAAGWAVGQGRVAALEDRLAGLEASAPDEPGRTRARTLRDAVGTVRRRLNVLITSGQVDTLQREFDAVAAELEAALATSRPAW
jgi:hypothetical protein